MPRRHPIARGFTLIEAAVTTVIIGVGCTASMRLFAACTQTNAVGGQLHVAALLADNLREALAPLPFTDPSALVPAFGRESGETTPAQYDDIDDFDGLSFSPPLDAGLNAQADFAQYTQSVTVTPVTAARPSAAAGVITKSGTGLSAVRVTVVVSYRTDATQPLTELQRLSWIKLNQ